jgi:methionyl-tRNA formyltransferase
MQVLLLSPYPERILATIKATNDEYIAHQAPLNTDDYSGLRSDFDFIISYGYRHILKEPARLPPAINLHISYLPWNRGVDPNLWSWIDNTPKGVTIHQIDEGVDTGPILAQQKTEFFAENATLASTYERLQESIEELFELTWDSIRAGGIGKLQSRGGTYHSRADRARVAHLLTKGWDTPISQLIQGIPSESPSPRPHRSSSLPCSSQSRDFASAAPSEIGEDPGQKS